MKPWRMLLIGLVLSEPLLASPGIPVVDTIQLEAEELEQRRARIHACWEEARGDSAGAYWRASLDDQLLSLKVGSREHLGPLQSSVSLEQEWLDELQARRAQVSLSVPYKGWEVGVTSNMDWQAQREAAWQLQPVRMGGWLQSPEWRGWKARASYTQQEEVSVRRLALDSSSRHLEAEVSQSPEHRTLVGRVSQSFGRSTLALEGEQRTQLAPPGSSDLPEASYWQRRWLARYTLQLTQDARLSAEGVRRWSELDWEHRVEARMELRF